MSVKWERVNNRWFKGTWIPTGEVILRYYRINPKKPFNFENSSYFDKTIQGVWVSRGNLRETDVRVFFVEEASDAYARSPAEKLTKLLLT
jgi:hypothetical protein